MNRRLAVSPNERALRMSMTTTAAPRRPAPSIPAPGKKGPVGETHVDFNRITDEQFLMAAEHMKAARGRLGGRLGGHSTFSTGVMAHAHVAMASPPPTPIGRFACWSVQKPQRGHGLKPRVVRLGGLPWVG